MQPTDVPANFKLLTDEVKVIQNIPPTLEIEEWFIVVTNVGGAPGWTVRAYGWKIR